MLFDLLAIDLLTQFVACLLGQNTLAAPLSKYALAPVRFLTGTPQVRGLVQPAHPGRGGGKSVWAAQGQSLVLGQ